MSSMLGNRGMSPATGASQNLKGTGYQSVSTLSPEKMQLFQMLLGGGSEGLQGGLSNLSKLASGGDEEYWKQLEAPAMRQFGELQGQIGSRFSGMGTGARRSSGFQNTQNSAAAGLAERLQSNRMGLQQQAIRDLLGLSQSLLGTEDQALMEEKKKGLNWGRSLSGAGTGAATGALVGSVVPGIGTGIGAGVGAGAGFLSGLFSNY